MHLVVEENGLYNQLCERRNCVGFWWLFFNYAAIRQIEFALGFEQKCILPISELKKPQSFSRLLLEKAVIQTDSAEILIKLVVKLGTIHARFFLLYMQELYKPSLKPSLIRLKIDSNVKIHMTQYVTWAAVCLWEQSDTISENCC